MSDSKILVCPSCGQKNRVKVAAAGVPHCARCGSPLPWLVDISTTDFQAGVADSPVPVLADFWAPWCGPCRMVAPAVEKIANDLAGRVKVVKINIDDEPAIAQQFQVQSIPLIGLFRNGRLERQSMGAKPRQQIEAELGMLVIP